MLMTLTGYLLAWPFYHAERPVSVKAAVRFGVASAYRPKAVIELESV
jgi:hypothetical protein